MALCEATPAPVALTETITSNVALQEESLVLNDVSVSLSELQGLPTAEAITDA